MAMVGHVLKSRKFYVDGALSEQLEMCWGREVVAKTF